MVLLLVAGIVLSRITLRTVNRATATEADAAGSARERRPRKIYKAVLLLSGAYFYLSIPILLGTIVAAGCGAVLVFLAMGFIPIKLVVLIGIVLVATVGAILRSLDHDVDATIKEVIDKRRPLPNLYRYERESKKVSDSDLATEIEKEMVRQPTIYDSHPSPRQRLAWAEEFAVARAPQPDDDASVWALFVDRVELERAMTSEVRDRILANHGVKILAVMKPGRDEETDDDGKWKGYGDSDGDDETQGGPNDGAGEETAP